MVSCLSAILSLMIQDESTFARAEALYAESFRSDKSFTVADGIYERSELVHYLMEPIYKPSAPSEEPRFFRDEDDDDGCVYDDCLEPEILKPGMSREDAEKVVDHLQFVETCNYKGEGEGFELLCRVAHLRVFVSKYEYLDAA